MECFKMTLLIDGRDGDVSGRLMCLSTSSPDDPTARASKPKRLDDPWACQTEGKVADLKRRIPILKRLIADFDRLATDLAQEVRNEEHRAKIHNPAAIAYPIYARATAWRRDNLRRSADELRTHLAQAEKALLDLGEATLNS
jgi:hypothetical protein